MSYLTIIMNFFFTCLFIITTYSVASFTTFMPWKVLLLLLFPFALFFIRKNVKKVLPFVLAHFGMAAIEVVIFMLGNIRWPEWVCFAPIWAIYIGVSFSARKKNETAEEPPMHPIGMFLAAFACFIVVTKKGDPSWGAAIMYCLVGYFVLFFISYYFDRYTSFVKLNRIGQTRLQEKRLLSAGAGIMLGYAIFSGFIMLISSGTSFMNDIAAFLGNALKKFIIFILSHLPAGEVTEFEDAPVEEVVQSNDFFPAVAEDNSWLNLLWRAIEKVVTIALFIAAVVALYYLGKLIIESLRKLLSREVKKPVEFKDAYVKEHSEKLEVRKRSEKSGPRFFDFSNNARIRRTYAKLIARSRNIIEEKTGKTLSHLTARECLEAIFEKDKADAAASIYEAARYSLLPVSAEDVANMNKLASSMRK